MRIYRATYNVDGKKREAAKWYVELKDAKGRIRRLPGFTDRGATREFASKLQRLVNLRGAGDVPDAALSAWLEQLPDKTRATLERLNIIDARRAAAAKPLAEHVAAFAASLRARGNSERHVGPTIAQVERVIRLAAFAAWNDVSALVVERVLSDLRSGADGISAATSNHLLGAVRSFTRWMVRNGLAIEDPLRSLRPLNAKLDRRRERWVMSTEQLRTLLTTTAQGPERCGMPGAERALLYRLALETGLRVGELTSLRVASFDLDAARPTVKLQAAYSKRRREDVLPLRPDMATALAPFLASRIPTSAAFRIPRGWRAAEMLAADLEAADLKVQDGEGRVFDFHALRHSFISNLANGGVAPKVAQSLARHSTITLTLDRYTHLRADDDVRALDALPDLSRPPSPKRSSDSDAAALRATGTETHLASSWAKTPSATCTSTPAQAAGMVGRAGLEPAQPCGFRILSPMRLPVSPSPRVHVRISFRNASASAIDCSISRTRPATSVSIAPRFVCRLAIACAFRLCFRKSTWSWNETSTGSILDSARFIAAMSSP